MTSVIIVQHNAMHLTRQAITSFREFHTSGYEIILVDNGSTEDGLDELRRDFPAVRILALGGNLGFGRANNKGAGVATGEILLFLNNDTVSVEPILPLLEREFRNDPGLGVLGPRLLNPDRSFQLSAGWLPTFWKEIGDKFMYRMVDARNPVAVSLASVKFSHPQEVGWVTGAALLIRSELFRKLGGFDEKITMYFEDKDLCLRAARAGMKVRYAPEVALAHIKGGSSSAGRSVAERVYRESQLYYYRKHRPAFESMLLRFYLKASGKFPA